MKIVLLERNSAGTDVPVPVWDHQPENTSIPFVTLGGHARVAIDTLDAELGRHAVYLAVWSQYRGQRQVLAIMSEIRERLHNVMLSLESGECLLCRVTSQLSNPEPDDITYQGAMTITVIAAD